MARGLFPRGNVRVRWNGRDANGERVPDGVYLPLVKLERAGRTIDLPNPIRVDTMKPTITATRPPEQRAGSSRSPTRSPSRGTAS